MFKKLFIVFIALMLLCSCGTENSEGPSEPIVPSAQEEPEVIPEAETPEEEKIEFSDTDFLKLRLVLEYPELNPTPCDFEGGYPYKSIKTEVPAEVEELLYRMRRAGEFENARAEDEKMIYAALMALPMVSKYDLEAETAEKMSPLFEEIGDECFYPEEWVEIAAAEIFSGRKEFEHQSLDDIGFVYHKKAGVYTPPHKGLNTIIPYIVSYSENGRFCTAEFFYMEASMSGYQLGDGDVFVPCEAELNENLFEKQKFIEFAESGKDLYVANIIKEDDGGYRINDLYKKVIEPKLIAEHIAMLNELEGETFGIEHRSWQEENYVRLYKEKPYGENFELAEIPDALEPSSTFYGVSMGEGYQYNGYYVDLNCEGVYPATNFSSKLEVFENLCEWFAPEIIEESSFENHVMDFEGKVYLLRHSKGYGTSYYGDSEIIEQTETEMTAIAKIYRIVKEEAGTAEIKFEKIDGRWIIVSIEDNYY